MGPPLHMHVVRPPTHYVVQQGVMEQQGSLMVREEGKIGSTGQSMSPIPPINEIMHEYIWGDYSTCVLGKSSGVASMV